MSYKKDPVLIDREVEMDNLDIVPYIQSVALIRKIGNTMPVYETPVDEDGLPDDYRKDASKDFTIPGAYIPLHSWALIVKELHSQGYRIVKGAEHKPYFLPI